MHRNIFIILKIKQNRIIKRKRNISSKLALSI